MMRKEYCSSSGNRYPQHDDPWRVQRVCIEVCEPRWMPSKRLRSSMRGLQGSILYGNILGPGALNCRDILRAWHLFLDMKIANHNAGVFDYEPNSMPGLIVLG
jgi:hypothetical protein